MPWLGAALMVLMLLALAWWGWQRMGLGALQLGMSC
jgi:hypothetical protein